MGVIGCQDVFTYSPFEAFQRDPSSLPPEQKKTYAESALASGSKEEMNKAYDAIKDLAEKNQNDGDLQLLAADLAMGASGMGDITDSISDLLSSENTDEVVQDPEQSLDTFETMIKDLDAEKLSAVETHIDSAEKAGAEVSSSQYVNAGMAIAANEVKKTGIENIDIENPSEDMQKALDYAEKGGVDLESVMSGEFEGF
jgi:hypothetical protein